MNPQLKRVKNFPCDTDRGLRKVAVIGGGISGVATGWFLRNHADVTIFEKSDRLGGWIRSEERDGFFFEHGPRSFRHDPFVLDLVQQLGLNIQTAASSNRYLFSQGKLRKVGLSSVLLPLLKEWRVPPFKGDESIGDFFRRRFGKKFTDTYVEAIVNGIWAGDKERLSMQACFPKLKEWETQYGSLARAFIGAKGGKIFTIEGGMERLVEALAAPSSVRFEEADIAFKTVNGETFDHIILTVPYSALQSMFGGLPQLPHVSMDVVHLGWNKTVLQREGFGYLVQNDPLYGAVWDSSAFPRKEDETRITVMLRSGNVNTAREGIKRHMGVNVLPDYAHHYTATNAIPQYHLGHAELIKVVEKRVKEYSPHITLSGSPFYGVAVADCLKRAEACAKSLNLAKMQF